MRHNISNNDEKTRRRAGRAVRKAIKKGLIIRPNVCSDCGCEARVEGHHSDYSKPLDVIWLCPKCHAKHSPLHHHMYRPKPAPRPKKDPKPPKPPPKYPYKGEYSEIRIIRS